MLVAEAFYLSYHTLYPYSMSFFLLFLSCTYNFLPCHCYQPVQFTAIIFIRRKMLFFQYVVLILPLTYFKHFKSTVGNIAPVLLVAVAAVLVVCRCTECIRFVLYVFFLFLSLLISPFNDSILKLTFRTIFVYGILR